EPAPETPASALTLAPNPLRASATLALTLARPGSVRLAVYDGLGREVAVLLSGTWAAGRHEVVFNAATLPPGVYFLRAEAGGSAVTRVLTVLR
ncbi:MAG TPA: T9SS type A sorting domain-containing protein, partial [Rubricoccaceae bacterium]|nr:T9SS type A sorting domain-containing protein [Rubricoccaceae bacterium]